MSPVNLQNELDVISGTLNRWRAEALILVFIAGGLALLWICALSDLYFRYEKAGRITAAAPIAIILAAGAGFVISALCRKRSAPAVAARLEHAFPQLDNHLINYVLFSAKSSLNPIEAAYLQNGLPEWQQIRVGALRDRKTQVKSYLAILAAALVLGATYILGGQAWLNAVLRIANPFSGRAPATFAQIESIIPGNTTVIQGSPLTISCAATGKKGHNVLLELWPADDKQSSINLGSMTGAGREEFQFQITNVTTGFKYRLRAGDALSARYEVSAVAPLAIAKLAVTVKPPAYTRLEGKTFEGLSETPPIPEGSQITLALTCNRDIAAAQISGENMENIKMAPAGREDNQWTAELVITGQQQLVISAADKDKEGGSASATLKLNVIPDKGPSIRILAPAGKTILAEGAAPQIQWEITDDFGIGAVQLEQITMDSKAAADILTPAKVIQEWSVTGGTYSAAGWTGSAIDRKTGTPCAFRLVACDNRPDNPNRSVSPAIVFDWTAPQEIQAQSKQTGERAEKTLETLLELQQVNLKETIALDSAINTVQAQQWKPIVERQRNVRETAGQLLNNPQKPLGSLTETVRNLYMNAMNEAIDVLDRIPGTGNAEKKADLASLSQRAIMLEQRILRGLSRVDAGMETVKQNREVTGLLSALDLLVKDQETTLETTKALLPSPNQIGQPLIQKQDRLASDLTAFVQTCRKESVTMTATDVDFSKLLVRIADECDNNKVPAVMLRAAEQLEKKLPDRAAPFQTEALTALKNWQKLMNSWRIQDAAKTSTELREALENTSNKLEKMAKIEAKLADAVRESSRQEDKSKKKTEELDEELEDAQQQIEDALLNIAVDLQIFPQLPVGNDLVEDLFQVYEEVKQAKDSERTQASELGLQKEDWIMDAVEAMQKTKERIDDVETWLGTKPDSTKRNTEDFDQQEMPKLPVIPMASEMEDLISDLLKQEEDISEKSDDSATNQGAADGLFGWDVAEGEFVDYSAKGKSGNTAPDHKDQDGRANVGREGMSDGEATAASGKINEGDKNIDKRMTQDSSQSGQVQEDGHSKAKATGGGKNSGYGDELGMAGSGPRRDANTKQGSELGLQAMLRRNAQALHARSELAHVRSGSLDEAVRHMRSAEEALEKGYPINQVREFQRRAVTALKKTKTELNAPLSEISDGNRSNAEIDDQIAGARDEAPAEYKQMVADYFKSLGTGP